jgi:hypothetical protein
MTATNLERVSLCHDTIGVGRVPTGSLGVPSDNSRVSDRCSPTEFAVVGAPSGHPSRLMNVSGDVMLVLSNSPDTCQCYQRSYVNAPVYHGPGSRTATICIQIGCAAAMNRPVNDAAMLCSR